MSDVTQPWSARALLELAEHPARAGRLASERRTALFGRQIAIVAGEALPAGSHPALLLRRHDVIPCPQWPDPVGLENEDQVLIDVPADHDGRTRWIDYLQVLALPSQATLSAAPFSSGGAALHGLWAIAVARLVLPGHCRVQARHDRLGIRLAQVALGFGADTLAGPLASERQLPLAGVTRPNEHSLTGLSTLIQQLGLTAQRPATGTQSQVQP